MNLKMRVAGKMTCFDHNGSIGGQNSSRYGEIEVEIGGCWKISGKVVLGKMEWGGLKVGQSVSCNLVL